MRRLCPLFLVALFALCSLFSTAQEKNPLLQSGNLIDQASQLSDSGDYKKAIELYQRVDRNDTNYVRALYGISLSYYADSQFNMAMSYCKKAIALNKDASWEPDLYNQYGNSVDAAGDPQQAIRVYDSAIQKYPAHMLLYQNKGNLLMKLKRYPEAEAVLQKALLINPFAYTIHYKLAVCALAEGKLIPAFFSFIGYLVLTPEGRYHANAINVLSAISKNEDDIQKLVSERTEQPSENYQLLEQIVQSKIALDDNYKPVIRLDDKISRQIQVVFEKMQYQESDPDFWIQYYVPFYKSIFSDNQFEPFINYIFSTADLPIIKEYNKKNKKEISAFVDKAAVYFSLIRSSRELNLSRRNADSAAWIFSGGQLAGHGKYYQKGDKLVGPWEFYYGPGNIKARSAFDEQGRKMGPYTYYFVDGKVKGKEFYRDGKQEGEETYYFSNGLPSSHSWYKDGQPEGESVSYYFMGLPSAVSHYHAGKLDGVKVSFFSSGDSNLVEHYTAGVRSGEVRSWYQNRQADVMANYSNDKLDGAYKKYYPNGKLNTEGVYKAGKQEGPWKYYYPNGQLKSVINFANDKQEGDYKEFSDKGRLAVTYSFRKGKIDGEARYFDEDSVLYSTLQFDNDQLSKARYFDKKGKMINESTRNGKTINLTTFLPDCSKKSTLVYNEKSNIEGTEIFFYPSGKTYETDEYANGKEQGPSIVYYPDGVKKSETMYSGGQMDGYHRGYYSHGGVEQEGWYKDGSVAGYWLSYNEMGDLTDSAYYLNGDIEGTRSSYSPNGKKSTDTWFKSGWLKGWVDYDSTGKETQRVELMNGTATIELVNAEGKPAFRANYVHGQLQGGRHSYYFDGRPLWDEYYINGVQDSVYKAFFHSGKVSHEGHYRRGDKAGVWKTYYPDGSLQIADDYADGKLNGKKRVYYENGKLETEIDYTDGERNGYLQQYDPDGTPAYRIRYKDNKAVGYSYLDKNKVPVPEITIPGSGAKMKTYFPNGQLSGEWAYQDGFSNGPDKLYYTNGQLKSECVEHFGNYEGHFLEYHPNGKLKRDHPYVHDNLHGVDKEYNEKGILITAAGFYCGAQHGVTQKFDEKGNLAETDLYYYGQLLSTK